MDTDAFTTQQVRLLQLSMYYCFHERGHLLYVTFLVTTFVNLTS